MMKRKVTLNKTKLDSLLAVLGGFSDDTKMYSLNKKGYTSDEIAVMRKHVGNYNSTAIAKIIGRSTNAINRMLYLMRTKEGIEQWPYLKSKQERHQNGFIS